MSKAEEIVEEIVKDLFAMPHQPSIGVKRTVEDNRMDLRERIKAHTNATLQELKERVRKREEELQRIIGADEYSNQYLAVKESRIDELKRVNETIEELQDE